MPERRAGDVVRVEERVVRALGLLPPEEPAVLGGREGLAQRRAKGVHVGELARRGGRKAHEVLGPRGAAGSESDHAARDILIKAILEAKKGMPESGSHVLMTTWKWAPAGVVEQQKWWSGRSAYYGGRAPMARLVELPDDVLRRICEQLVPLVPPKEKPLPSGYVGQSNEEFLAESRKSCEEDTTDAALQRRGEVQLDELSESFDDSALRHRIQSWRRERGPVSVLCKVSKQWRAGLKKHIDVLRAEIARYEAHRAVLADASAKVYNHRVSRFGEPRDPYDEDY